MTYLDSVLQEIKTKGQQNLAAIVVHKSIKAGKRGATGLQSRKFEARGVCRPMPRKVSAAEPTPLPRIRITGKPLACTGPKPDGDGYKRDRITAVITRC